MEPIIIGVDPHKLSATIEVVDDRERFLGSGQFTTDQAGYTAMLPASCAARSSAKAMTVATSTPSPPCTQVGTTSRRTS